MAMLSIATRCLAVLALAQAFGAAVEVPLALATTPAWDLLPPPHGAGAVVYDSRRHRELWLNPGGILTVPDAPVVSWERVWRGNNPPRKFGEFVVYDSTSDRIWTASAPEQVGATTIPGKVWYMDLSAPVLQWTDVAYAGDVPMVGGYGYALDPVRRRILTFGGYSTCSFCDPTSGNVYSLALDGTPTWSPVNPSGSAPTPRFGSAMVYDAWRDRMLVYGGSAYGPSYFDQTWSLALGSMSWSLLSPAGSVPSARNQQSAGAAVLDPIERRWMIFGGNGPSGEYNDTWALDLSASASAGSAAWTPIADGENDPRPRLGRTIFCQPEQSRMLLARGDLWGLGLDSDPAWSLIGGDSLGQLSRKGFIAFLDPATRRVFAGLGNDDSLQVRSADVLEWWTTLPDQGPSARYGACVGVDETGRQALVFGGGTDRGQRHGTEFSDLWSYDLDGGGWTELTPATTPSIRTAALGVFDPNHGRFIIHGGRTFSSGQETIYEDTWSYDVATGTWSAVGGTGYEGRFGEIGIYDPVRDRIVTWGGGGSFGPHYSDNDMHILPLGSSVGSWSAVSTAGTPPRYFFTDYGFGFEVGAYASYDPVGDRMIVVSKDAPTAYTDGVIGVWQMTLDANPTWSKLAADWSPIDRYMPGASVFDEQGGRMLLMGGTGDPRVNPPPDPTYWGLYMDGSPPTWISLLQAGATSNHVDLHWQAAERRNLTVDVLRRNVGGSWGTVAQRTQDASGGITFVDNAIAAGARYDYRLAVNESGLEGYYGETRIGVPGTTGVPTEPLTSALALGRAHPNPTGGPLTVTFSLASDAPATLAMYDVTGRRVTARAVGALGSGTHTLRLDDARVRLPVGLYFLRLEQGGRSLVGRVAIAR